MKQYFTNAALDTSDKSLRQSRWVNAANLPIFGTNCESAYVEGSTLRDSLVGSIYDGVITVNKSNDDIGDT